MKSAISGTSPSLPFVGTWATAKVHAGTGSGLHFQLKVSPIVSTKSAASTVIPVTHLAVDLLGGSSNRSDKDSPIEI